MDMVMPGGRHIYLRAASMTERQQWLLALGVAKQGGLESIDSSMNYIQWNLSLIRTSIKETSLLRTLIQVPY